jgi:probable rRNA maturation factor
MSAPAVALHLAPEADLAGLEELAQEAEVARVVAAAWSHADGPLPAHVEVALTGEEEHCRLHARFLDDPTPTDVMAFPYEDDDAFGEVVVNVDMARREGAERGHGARVECTLYLVHGCLHLLGYDDHDDAQRARMRDAESSVMRALGFADA